MLSVRLLGSHWVEVCTRYNWLDTDFVVLVSNSGVIQRLLVRNSLANPEYRYTRLVEYSLALLFGGRTANSGPDTVAQEDARR